MKCPTCGQINYSKEGGKARALKLSPERRKEIAKKASRSRKLDNVRVAIIKQAVDSGESILSHQVGICVMCNTQGVLSPVMIHGMRAMLCGKCQSKA